MTEKCANSLAGWLINCDAITEGDRELYAYAIHSLLLSFAPLLLALGLGIWMGCIRQSLGVTFPFMVIRKFSGGYHTRHPWTCLLGSFLLLYLCISLSLRLSHGQTLAFIAVGASASLILFSPIDNENRKLSLQERRCYRKITASLVIIFLSFDVLFLIFRLDLWSICISISILLTSVLQIPCIFGKIKRPNKGLPK